MNKSTVNGISYPAPFPEKTCLGRKKKIEAVMIDIVAMVDVGDEDGDGGDVR